MPFGGDGRKRKGQGRGGEGREGEGRGDSMESKRGDVKGQGKNKWLYYCTYSKHNHSHYKHVQCMNTYKQYANVQISINPIITYIELTESTVTRTSEHNPQTLP